VDAVRVERRGDAWTSVPARSQPPAPGRLPSPHPCQRRVDGAAALRRAGVELERRRGARRRGREDAAGAGLKVLQLGRGP
jgi:hypothetical protein